MQKSQNRCVSHTKFTKTGNLLRRGAAIRQIPLISIQIFLVRSHVLCGVHPATFEYLQTLPEYCGQFLILLSQSLAQKESRGTERQARGGRGGGGGDWPIRVGTSVTLMSTKSVNLSRTTGVPSRLKPYKTNECAMRP